eukprot:5341699-Lingulodinium_polyedra.AAC.1
MCPPSRGRQTGARGPRPAPKPLAGYQKRPYTGTQLRPRPHARAVRLQRTNPRTTNPARWDSCNNDDNKNYSNGNTGHAHGRLLANAMAI